MRTVWKWIIGIVVGLLVLGLLGVGVWVLVTRIAYVDRVVQVIPRNLPTPNAPNNQNPYYQGPNGGPYMMPYGHRGYPLMPMMSRRGFGIAPIIGGIIGFLFFTGFIVLLVLGILWLVRRNSRPAAMASAAGTAPVPPASTAAGTHACANCGQMVTDGFEYCPHCGTKQ
jgi:hypothetical protein